MSLKIAFDNSSVSSMFAAPNAPTIGDLLREIKNDRTMSMGQQMALIAELNSATGSIPKHTLIGSVGSMTLGSVLFNLVAKYFNMGPVGRALATVAGAGVGNIAYNHITSQGIPGWRMAR